MSGGSASLTHYVWTIWIILRPFWYCCCVIVSVFLLVVFVTYCEIFCFCSLMILLLGVISFLHDKKYWFVSIMLLAFVGSIFVSLCRWASFAILYSILWRSSSLCFDIFVDHSREWSFYDLHVVGSTSQNHPATLAYLSNKNFSSSSLTEALGYLDICARNIVQTFLVKSLCWTQVKPFNLS